MAARQPILFNGSARQESISLCDHRPWSSVGAALVLLAISGFSAAASGSAEPMPEPEAIRPNVEFWTRVFSEWSVTHAVEQFELFVGFGRIQLDALDGDGAVHVGQILGDL